MRKENFTWKFITLLVALFITGLGAKAAVGPDTVAIHNLGHASIHMEYKNLHIYVDPYSAVADFDLMPDADLIFVTHEHADHYDLTALNKLKKAGTILVTTQAVRDLGTYTGTVQVLYNGQSTVVMGIPVKAVPAYNVLNTMYHPRGEGNGYVFTFDEKKVYVAGGTENIPEMRMMGRIDVAFLPMNLPYTMTPAEVFTAGLNIRPDILYVYHYETSDTALVRALLKNYIKEIRIGPSLYYLRTKTATTASQKILRGRDLVFYPNPVVDYIIVSDVKRDSEICVYDMAGKLLLRQQITDSGDQRLELGALRAGAYLLKYKDKDVIKSNVIVKK